MNSLDQSQGEVPRGIEGWIRFALATLFFAMLLNGSALAAAQLEPLGDPFVLHQDPLGAQVEPAVCSHSDGAFVAVWNGLGDWGEIRFQRFSAAASPLGPELQVSDGSRHSSTPAIGCLPGGGALVVWVQASDDYGISWLRGRTYAPTERRFLEAFDVSLGDGWNVDPHVACSTSGCAVTWRREDFGDNTAEILTRLLDLSGIPQGPEIFVLPGPDDRAPLPDVAIGPDGAFAVAWARRYGTEVSVRRFGAQGEPDGGMVSLISVGETYFELGSPSLSLDSAGNLFAAWTEGPDNSDPFLHCVRAVVLNSRNEFVRAPFAIDDEPSQRFSVETLLDASGSFVALWGSPIPKNHLVGRIFDRSGAPRGPAVTLVENPRLVAFRFPMAAAPRPDGSLVLVWELQPQIYSPDVGGLLIRSGSPQPPEGPWLSSPSLPDFQFKARISTATSSIAGAQEASCIPETLCLSGALPGRSEVFLRVVGPKPNGRMWPTLVKFSTSTVEVWVRQDSSGEVRYYRLEGARPGYDELPGLFDRDGFAPGAGALSAPAASPGLTFATPRVLAGSEAPAPPGAVFTSEHFPGFRFRARISAGEQVQEVRKEAACIEETLCLSGALPGRSEMFVRIVGPKPNGRLWPTIVKFTTSTVEVWIEQLSTGEERYYRIEGAAPGKDDLTGLFDRDGFAP